MSIVQTYTLIYSYLIVLILIAKGMISEFKSKKKGKGKDKINTSWFEDKYVKYVYGYCKGCFERRVSKFNGDSTMEIEGIDGTFINFGSYNYLGFGGGKQEEEFEEFFNPEDGGLLSMCCSVNDVPVNSSYKRLLRETERKFSEFIGVEDTVIFPMGWGTNVNVISILADKNTLILSDEYNHASIAMGCKLIGCKIIPFKNNCPEDLEMKILREVHRHDVMPYNKILIIIEGLYSMEGNISILSEFMRIKTTYRAYLYVDEAHSIGAVGKNGRGICEYYSVDPANIDILMGTFTKAFSSIGGYVSGSKKVVRYIRNKSPGLLYDTTITPTCLRQILYVLDQCDSGDFEKRVDRLRDNTNYARSKFKINDVKTMIGQEDSPVIPIITVDHVTMNKVSMECYNKHNIALVVAGYPATAVNESRVRLCVSASHTKEQIDKVVKCISSIVD